MLSIVKIKFNTSNISKLTYIKAYSVQNTCKTDQDDKY